MAKKGSSSQPAAPDPAALSQAQAEANRINVYSPYGQVEYGGPNKSNMTITPSDNQAQIISGQEEVSKGLLQRAQREVDRFPEDPLSFDHLPNYVSGVDQNALPGLQSEIDVSGLPGLPGMDDYNQSALDTQNAVFERGMNLLRPELDQRREAINQEMANRGLPVGGEAYSNSMDRFDRGANEAMSNLALDAVTRGNDEAARRFAQTLQSRGQGFGEQVTAAGFQNTARGQALSDAVLQANMQNSARQQGISENMTLRANRFNALAAMLGGQQVNMPQSVAPGQVDVISPAMGAYNAQVASANQSSANANALAGAGISLAGTLGGAGIIAASDRRLKKDIV
jgi:hypothetical protein